MTKRKKLTKKERAAYLTQAHESARDNMWCEYVEAGRPAVGSGHSFVEPDDRTDDEYVHQVVCAWDNLATENRYTLDFGAAPTIEEVSKLRYN